MLLHWYLWTISSYTSVNWDGENCDCWSLQWGNNTSLCCSWNPASSNTKISSLDRLVPIFTCHVLDTIGQSNTYFFLLPLTQRLISSWQNQHSYFTLLGERNSFMSPLHVRAGVSCLLVSTLTLHMIPVIPCNAQHCLVELDVDLAMRYLEAR